MSFPSLSWKREGPGCVPGSDRRRLDKGIWSRSQSDFCRYTLCGSPDRAVGFSTSSPSLFLFLRRQQESSIPSSPHSSRSYLNRGEEAHVTPEVVLGVLWCLDLSGLRRSGTTYPSCRGPCTLSPVGETPPSGDFPFRFRCRRCSIPHPHLRPVTGEARILPEYEPFPLPLSRCSTRSV